MCHPSSPSKLRLSPVQMRACATQQRPPPATFSFSSLSMMAISCGGPPELTLELAMLAWPACMMMRSSPLTASLQPHDESDHLSHTALLQAPIRPARSLGVAPLQLPCRRSSGFQRIAWEPQPSALQPEWDQTGHLCSCSEACILQSAVHNSMGVSEKGQHGRSNRRGGLSPGRSRAAWVVQWLPQQVCSGAHLSDMSRTSSMWCTSPRSCMERSVAPTHAPPPAAELLPRWPSS